MRLKYVGPFISVVIPEMGGQEVANGEIVDVEDDIGKRLAASTDWQVTSRKKGDDD